MALNQVERLNVFDTELSNELRSRSSSTNLVRTRAPFLRFTTGATMSELSQRVAGANNYAGCRFFTLGLHGWDNKNYSADSIYGTQADKGLVVGTTYKDNTQILVTSSDKNHSKNYPPPGITSAKVERLRNGNVLRFTIETECFTQEQLEILDQDIDEIISEFLDETPDTVDAVDTVDTAEPIKKISNKRQNYIDDLEMTALLVKEIKERQSFENTNYGFNVYADNVFENSTFGSMTILAPASSDFNTTQPIQISYTLNP